jgi:putative flippase GtrA
MVEWRAVKRFLHYSLIGLGTFLFDLALLFLFKEVFSVHYLWSAGSSFLIAVSINYLLSRHFVFRGTERSQVRGYVYFIAIALSGLGIVTGALYVLVEFFGLHYLLARVLIAGLSGIWNYSLNLFFNFKVAGVYDTDAV